MIDEHNLLRATMKIEASVILLGVSRLAILKSLMCTIFVKKIGLVVKWALWNCLDNMLIETERLMK